MNGLSRAQFLAHGLKGGVALAVGGTFLAGASPAFAGEEPAVAPPEGDTAILRLAASAELLAQDFYRRAIDARKFEKIDRRYLSAALANERAHYDALAKAIGTGAPVVDDFVFTYGNGAFKSVASIARLGVSLETAFVGAYVGAAGALETPELRVVAAQIGASEATHLSVFSEISGGQPVGPAFPGALTVEQASAALDPFLGE